ncbi:cubilin-like [Ptychodera flava]|uniref:cubilin-like n=1 Tax=Ptychodera flava TaxID=63121 RepID=UPI00396A7507
MGQFLCQLIWQQITAFIILLGAVILAFGQIPVIDGSASQTNSTIEVCNATSCQNGGTCNSNYACECLRGFYGSKCQYVSCNGDVFVEEEATVSSPNYPHKYPFYDQCTYNIRTQPGNLLQIHFMHFEIENSTDCAKDRLLIYDGRNESWPLFGKYCGFSLPSNIITSGNSIHLMFLTDGSVEQTGFEATITAVPDDGTHDATRKLYSVCEDSASKAFGGTLVSHFGYPAEGPPINNCTIKISPMNKYDRVFLSVKSVDLKDNIVKDSSCVIEQGVLRLGSGINDGHSHKVESAEACCVSCEGIRGCRAWSYDNSDGGTIGNCWLLDDQPYPETHFDFVSGILDPCTKQEQRILVYDEGKLSGGACHNIRHEPFVVRGMLELNALLGKPINKGNGFEATFTQFYIPDFGKGCKDDKDFLCENNRCIPGYLANDCDDHCGDRSDVPTDKCKVTVIRKSGWVLGVTLGLVLPAVILIAIVFVICYRKYKCQRGDPSDPSNDDKGNGMSTFNVFIAK